MFAQAAGSSLLYKLANALALDSLRQAGAKGSGAHAATTPRARARATVTRKHTLRSRANAYTHARARDASRLSPSFL